ncbi:nodulation protein NolU [Bradyrhizobium sp. Arg237L]|uniref:nodulation protein NolU n=1 Tax=Bradyrhizobium sp. Arg237L TaxID=3003352 RepID=UPI00249E8D9B|nr:nodulation protein NolU [Bradyrhizobium sp. Arg237L]MDI4231932.1 nodulation protein NolU [Bradyrhizobium sp. Arg237L]
MSRTGIGASPQTTTTNALSFLHPSRIAAALDQRLTAETIRKLQNCRRLEQRLAAQMKPGLVAQDLWPIPASADFLACPANPQAVARLAGAIWHAASLRLVVTGKAAAELVATIGEKAFAFGLRHAAASVGPAQAIGPSELAHAIDRDGLACLGAWLAGEAKPRRDAVLLRLSPEDTEQARQFSPEHMTACQSVMTIVMAEGETS